MRVLISTIIVMFISTSAFSRAYFAPVDEMITNAEVIASVTILKAVPARVEDEGKHYKDMVASVKVNQVIKGKLNGPPEIYIPNFFPCAIVDVKEGDFLVFLTIQNGKLTNSNWHLSLRPIKEGKVEWFSDTKKSFEFIEMREIVNQVNSTKGAR